jgi:hypothetical protein
MSTSAACQAINHPLRCLRLRIDASNDAAGEAATQVFGLDAHRQLVGVRCLHGRKRRRRQRRTGQRRQFARDAVHRQAVTEIRRQLERDQVVVERQRLAHVFAERRIGGKFEQAAMVVRKFQFARRAQHAEALDAAQLADADLERLAVVTRRQLGADQRQRHADADTRVRRTADDLQRPVL